MMNSRRTSLIALLAAVEVFIIGLGVYAVMGSRSWAFGNGGDLQRMEFTARPIAPIAAGSAPIVRIDDAESSVTVTLSTDNLVHVEDRTYSHGAIWGTSKVPQLEVARTADGVSITRPSYQDDLVMVFGDMNHSIDVQVPRDASVTIAGCSGADITGVNGAVTVASQDGHIRLTDITTASLSARSEDGSIVATGLNVSGPSPHALLHSDDGSIRVTGLFDRGGSYEVSTDDGSIRLALAGGSNTTIEASTGDGRIIIDGQSNDNGNDDSDSSKQTLRVGDGSGQMRVVSDDGSIHITTNGVQ